MISDVLARNAVRKGEHVTAVQLWLFLLREGGWWSPKELRNELGLSYTVNARLVDMKSRGVLVKHPLGMAKYGVTTRCKVPVGVTIEELLLAYRLDAPANRT